MANSDQYKTNKIPFGRAEMSTMSKFAIATKLTATANTSKVFYMEARKQGTKIKAAQERSFKDSYNLAQQINPSAILKYIPLKEQNSCKWGPVTSDDR